MAVKTVQGVAEASVKTVLGVANASVKTIMGVDMGGGGSPAWTYSREVADLDTSNPSDSNYSTYQSITLTAGTASKISIYSSQCDIGTVKIGLYDGSKNLLASGSVSSPNDGAAHDLEVTITNTAVSNGTYYVGFVNSTDLQQNWRYDSTVGTRLFNFSTNYAAFPNDPIAEDSSQAFSHRAGVYITP